MAFSLFKRWFGTDPPVGDPDRIAEVEAVLDDLRPLLAADGGDVDIVEVTAAGVVRLRWRGACRHCGARDTTQGAGLVPALEKKLVWFRTLEME
ncbi:MAG: NifU family protein [Planctomycetota bacterium]